MAMPKVSPKGFLGDLGTKKWWFNEISFWRDITAGIVSAFLLFIISTEVPFVSKFIKKQILEFKTEMKDPELICLLMEQHIRKGERQHALKLSEELSPSAIKTEYEQRIAAIKKEAAL